MVCSHSLAGVAPGEAAQSRGDGVGSGSSRRRPSRQRLKPGSSQPVAEEGLPGRQLLLVKLPSGGFGPYNARIAGPARRTKSSFADRFPQRRAGAIEEALHPGALASGVVIFADWFRQDRWCRHARAALGDVQVPLLIASMQLPV